MKIKIVQNFVFVLFLYCIGLHSVHALNVATANGNSLRFLVLGDWGGLPVTPFTTPIERAVANQMGKYANKTGAEFVLALGDNFYYSGIENIEDERFQETYNHIFTAISLDVEWYFIAGNHDHIGNVSAEIEFTKLMKRWMFPSYYYDLTFKIGKSTSTVEILMLDTIILCGNSDHDILGKQPNGPESVIKAEDQWTWLENKLKSSRSEYLIVCGHYPVLSIAEHGPTRCLVDRLMPMLYKYQVSAYFSGHDHNLQHLEYAINGTTMNYFISGSANFIDPSTKNMKAVPEGSSRFHWANINSLGGFADVQITETNMVFTFVEASGKQLYSKTIAPRKM